MAARSALRSGAVLLAFALIPACSFDGQFTAPFPDSTLKASLDGSQVLPAVVTTAAGSADMAIDTPQNKITYSVSATGLGSVTSVSIHLGEAGANGPAIFTLATGPFTSPLTGTLTDFDFTPAPSATTFHAATFNILNGKAYVLITTVAHPAGEIRGQIGPAPLVSAKMTGFQVVPPVATSGSGSATFTLSPLQDAIEVSVTFSGIGPTLSAYVQASKPGLGGATVFNLAPASYTSPILRTLRAADFLAGGGLTTFDDAVKALLTGQLYVTLQTTTFPGGEIRGQLGPTRLSAALAGTSVSPANSSTASGTASLTLNGSQNAVTVTLTHTLAAPIDVRLNADIVGSNGPLLFDVSGAAGFSTSPLSVELTQFDLFPQSSKGVNTFADATDALLTRKTYLDITTSGFLGGEIRGQIVP